ncbi:HAD family hydrolase [Haloactinomyces albus]|uniref:Hydrolase of the HAD superfamily n=1 Tax=Haloactinomyces albus TaxID=1352928 RepID=A0AAE3ZBA8_9ACTN|nr:HAD family phosphatase [Haloactinomyces albus]MDR7300364.1 putative hydrolase of the HAD superfamily [Haloactinomyces albus]
MAPTGARINAVIFDYGGVLTTPGRTAIAAWTQAERIKPDTFSATLKDWLSRRAAPGNPLHRLETGEMPVEEFNRILADRLRTEDGRPVEPEGLLARLFSFMRSDPMMLRLVEELQGLGVPTGLLSNSWGNNYPWQELDGLFDEVVVSGDVGRRKPDPEIYRLALERLALPAEQAVFVDDGVPNIEAARLLGMHTVLHENAEQTRRDLADLVPELEAERSQETA